MVGDGKKCMTLKHQIWCNFNPRFGVMVGDVLSFYDHPHQSRYTSVFCQIN